MSELLGARLKNARLDRGLSASAAAEHLGISTPTLHRIERGASGQEVGRVSLLCALYGLGAVATAELMGMAREAGKHGWWKEKPYRDWLSPRDEETLRIEDGAARLRIYSALVMPRMVLSPSYAMALSDDAIQRAVWERRQQMALSGRAELWIVMADPVLHVPVGTPAVMAEQMDHLIHLARTYRHVTIQIHPIAAGDSRAWTAGTWALVRHDEPELDDKLVRATPAGNELVSGETDAYLRAMDEASAQAAAAGEESIQLMQEAAKMWRDRA